MRGALGILLSFALLLPGCVDLSPGREASSEVAEVGTSFGDGTLSDAPTMMADSSTTYADRGSATSESSSYEASSPMMTRSGTHVNRGNGGNAGGLTAGDIDDHLNWASYLRYLSRITGGQDGQTAGSLPTLALDDRFTVRLVDATGAPVPLVDVRVAPVTDGFAQRAVTLVAGTDGLVRVLPTFDGIGDADAWRIEAAGASLLLREQDLDARREVTWTLPTRGSLPTALDLMLVIDTTGSMSDELSYLTRELRDIVAGIEQSEGVDVRVGLTVYRDAGDDYVVRGMGFSQDVSVAERWISAQEAGGGGDYPEAMDRALAEALSDQWRTDGRTARVVLLVADAPPHEDRYAQFLGAVRQARTDGVRIYPVAASGSATEAEFLMRASAALTQARYLFLTDDSGIGSAHAEPDVPCYVVTQLADLVRRVVRSELAGERVEAAPGEIVRSVGEIDAGVCQTQ